MNNKPILKIGIVSDSQCYDVRDDWGMSNLEKALKLLAPMEPEILFMPGDMADLSNFPGAFTLYRTLCREIFKDDPIQIACAGNHDLWHVDKSIPREVWFKQFCEYMDLPLENPYHTVIKGYDFITLSEDINCDYTDELVDKLAAELEKAAARNNTKPIFVITHFPPQDTMSGSYTAAGKVRFRELFNQYPQVISISGHTHYPLEDERCLWQGEFTALTASTLSYGCVHEPLFNVCNSIVPFAREAVQALYMEVYADRIDIHRYNVEDFAEIKPDRVWSFTLPYDPANPEYSIEKRAEKRTAPAFPEGSRMVLRYDYGFAYALFDAAKHEDMVQYYRIEAARKDENGVFQTVKSTDYISDFYRLECNKSKRMVFKLPEDMLVPGELHRISIYAIESFGKASEPLVSERVIPATWKLRPVDPMIMPQE